MDLVELRHFKEDGFDLLNSQDRLGGGGCCFQGLHGLTKEQEQTFEHFSDNIINYTLDLVRFFFFFLQKSQMLLKTVKTVIL